ncbi:non-histone chromosomal protein 6 [Rhizophagus clarus]|nr:non-histone chromosomal protein 6 [Rhizophagus clarus]
MDFSARSSDTTIGVQFFTNGDLTINQPVQPFHPPFSGNWISPLHPLYTYDPLPETQRKSKKKSHKRNNDSIDIPLPPPPPLSENFSENSSMSRPKRNYTKKPLDRLKRPRNGYMIYMNEVYDDVKRKHPNLKFGELSSLIGVQWKEMSKAQQMPYHQKHEEEKAAYEAAKLAMSRTNLQIVEETIDIEQQVKAAELRASQPKNKSNNKRSSTGDHSTEGKHKSVAQQPNNNSQGSKSKENSFVIPNVEPPETISTYIVTDRSKTNKLRHGIPITPTSPDFTAPNLPVENLTRRRSTSNQPPHESPKDEHFKNNLPETDKSSSKDDTNVEHKAKESDQQHQQSNEKNVSMSISSPDENMTDYEDEEEEVDQLQPSDRSDSEMEGVEIFSKSSSKNSISKSSTEVSSQENADLMSIDTTSIWLVPIEGTTVSPGLTPHRKRKIFILEDLDDERSNSNKISDIDNLKKCKQ